ncbi:MAG: carboxypeptidase-like regulatory domain-containing protein [Pirellulales bacterium]
MTLGLLITAGCGASGPSNLAEVTGVVLLDGAGVSEAQVVFTSSEPGEQPATAITDAEGKFTLGTYWAESKESVSGAAPGNYKVTVSKTEKPTQEQIDAAMAKSKTLATKNLLPKKYASSKSTTLQFEVKSSGENHYEISLEK